MAEWRLLRGWSSDELATRAERLTAAPLNFAAAEVDMTGEQGWHHYHSEAVIVQSGEDEACFERARVAVANYRFSDPGIVLAHFDPVSALLGRRLLLEIQVLGLHYLCPALVNGVRDEPGVYGFRYATLEGHIERGAEWFLITRNEQGEIRFRIEARWQLGQLPNWWSRLGFVLLAGRYQRQWHRRAHSRMALLARYGSTTPASTDGAGLKFKRQRVDVTFTYHTKRKWLQ